MDLVSVRSLTLISKDGKRFVDALDQLCQLYSRPGDYSFKFDIDDYIPPEPEKSPLELAAEQVTQARGEWLGAIAEAHYFAYLLKD